MTYDAFNNIGGSVGRNARRRRLSDPLSGLGIERELLPTYRVASWKGMEFLVDTSSDEFGRRGDSYEYPLGEDVAWKDLGRKPRKFKLDGYLLGSDQVDQTRRMRDLAERPEPGTLIHPMFGEQLVACISLTITADYRKDKKRTRLSFEFIEAPTSMAPYAAGRSLDATFDAATSTIELSRDPSLTWNNLSLNDPFAFETGRALSFNLGQQITGSNESQLDARSMLNLDLNAPALMGTPITATIERAPRAVQMSVTPQPTPQDVIYPIEFGASIIRRFQADALDRLREFNAFVVSRTRDLNTTSVQSLVISTRLIIMREYAWIVAAKTYDTLAQAIADLDFIMAVYDDEEFIATQRCDEPLVIAIRQARATAASAILARNIRLPGISEFPTDGYWPSLVVAHKIYGDARRFQQIENYNPAHSPFFVGRSVIAPAS